MKFIVLLFISYVLAQDCDGDDCEIAIEQDHTYLTYGSTFKLRHMMTGIRLHSLLVTYGMGSGQQAVTGLQDLDDVGSLWTVRCANKKCKSGEVIKNGDEIILTHVSTKKNLHSHKKLSEITGQQEVSCFGNNGIGDHGDVWIVESEKGQYWDLNGYVRLKHSDTNMYLNCNPYAKYGGPVSGQLEITAIATKTENTKWKAAEGFYLPASSK
ncbi:MIR domain containing protein [Entamoeba histolytica HM-1:IMSS-B]|uniref:MIR domain protein n=7 Tax=Entamoeba TaxID=5758 RepID=C4M0T6_ENTH1|nr:MIR domain protein [Entamoeba histolytica HM-1:IMSS]EMD42999.1 MIR domain containing protein [Entamoeba histolytica KU27]EMH76455.1 MIR domain containing protein [Entamoeba histolytica HM-1:IMSS-B]EMS17433.1 MIR domain containing protein [Entamoeba histolytica HM-3:IMSS]ENY65864.1 MIR domain containing protein [Entamoeba histolytica HM-1:IMSS-A]GAT94810.1 mir domain protein [Entamoeba histolytica]|eukprot:XP_655109.1 MIR domain protein [Entamoeba histolytica HM-1:IMSS]